MDVEVAAPAKPPERPVSNPDHGHHLAQRPLARLLIVEDDHFISLEIESLLKDAGYDVVGIAATASEAEELAQETRPIMAIMDIRLAGRRDGIEAAFEIFTKFGIRSLFVTAHEDAATRERATLANPLGWLAKPFSPASLIQAVRAALGLLS